VEHSDKFRELVDSFEKLYTFVSMTEGFSALKNHHQSGKPLLTLTFDDAPRSVYDHCLPILRARALPACIFVVPAYVDPGVRRVSHDKMYPVMSWANLEECVVAGLEIGSHTLNHIPLNAASLDRVKYEVLESQRILQDRLKVEVRHFAYPYGYFRDDVHDLLEQNDWFMTVSTTIALDNFPSQGGKHLNRKSINCAGRINSYFPDLGLYNAIYNVHTRRIHNQLSHMVYYDNQQL
jgi:peptidoglycan/xylan/chitin deacetylase (PgdA/CDA1 family)